MRAGHVIPSFTPPPGVIGSRRCPSSAHVTRPRPRPQDAVTCPPFFAFLPLPHPAFHVTRPTVGPLHYALRGGPAPRMTTTAPPRRPSSRSPLVAIQRKAKQPAAGLFLSPSLRSAAEPPLFRMVSPRGGTASEEAPNSWEPNEGARWAGRRACARAVC